MLRDKSLNMLFPKEKTIHGVIIKKLPNGKYFRVLQIINDFPTEALKALYPDKTAEEALEQMGEINFDKILELLPKLIELLPEKTYEILSEILSVDRNFIENELSPLETIEVLEELAKLNRFDELKKKFSPAINKIKMMIPTGYKH